MPTSSSHMNLICGTHHSCERREYAFMVLQEYLIIFPIGVSSKEFTPNHGD